MEIDIDIMLHNMCGEGGWYFSIRNSTAVSGTM